MTAAGRVWKLWAHRYEDGKLWHVGARRWVQLHDLDRPLVPVVVEEILGDRYAAEITHYGWDDKRTGHSVPSMIQIRAGLDPKRAMMMLAMCVGIDASNIGNVVPLCITETQEKATACRVVVVRTPGVDSAEQRESCDRLTRDNLRLTEEVNRLRAEIARLGTTPPTPIAPTPPPPGGDDAATRFSLLELD